MALRHIASAFLNSSDDEKNATNPEGKTALVQGAVGSIWDAYEAMARCFCGAYPLNVKRQTVLA